MSDDLVARLQSHSRAFEGLMSLIPANYYYGEDNDDQWKRKKQTKEQKRLAKRAKLDPSAYKSALDVHKEMERKRKLELEGDNENDSNVYGIERIENPREGLKDPRPASKKQKLGADRSSSTKPTLDKTRDADGDAARKKTKAEKRKEKRDKRKAQKAHKKEKKDAKKAQHLQEQKQPTDNLESEGSTSHSQHISIQDQSDDSDNDEQIENMDFSGLVSVAKTPGESMQDEEASSAFHSSRSPSLERDTPTFDDSAAPSSASSSSSINPPFESEPAKSMAGTPLNPPNQMSATSDSAENDIPHDSAKPRTPTPPRKSPKAPPVDQDVLKERLAAKIAALRAARKADGLDGKPARNRAELIEARRRKEEVRRAAKKEQRNKAKEHDAEAEARRLRGESGSPLWSSPGVFGPPRELQQENNFSFGKLKFADGTQMDPSFTAITSPKQRKGPQDPQTALEAAEHKADRLKGLDPEKRAEIEEKDRWLKARKRADGEKLKDDVSLLKKTLKKKQKSKEKSEKEWKERNEGIQKSIEARQAKRAENIAKRKEGRGGKKGSAKGSGSTAASKPRKRPGFEGSFKTGKRNFS